MDVPFRQGRPEGKKRVKQNVMFLFVKNIKAGEGLCRIELELRGRYSCQIICQQEQREAFDIHKYGSKVIEGMQRNQQIPFRRIVCGKPIFQICRLFLATLQLVSLGLRLMICLFM